MMADAPSLKLQVGARTLATIRRRLVRIPFSLDMVLDSAVPVFPTIDRAVHGYLMTSLPVTRVEDVADAMPGAIVHVVQRYVRYHVDLSIGHEAWLAHMSAGTRGAMRRKVRRLAEASGGVIDVRTYRGVTELALFHEQARDVSATTYQARLMDAGLPDDADFWEAMAGRAAADDIRAWLLCIDGRPAAYLLCSVADGVVRYDYVGHDPAYAALSPGSVLHAAAMRDLFDEGRFRLFDFTEGEGQHKRQFATGGTPCVDLLVLRRGLGNRATVAVLAGFAGAVRLAKRLAGDSWLTRRIRR